MSSENVYWEWVRMQNDGHYPSILAVGDSWFWYPFIGGSLLNYVGQLVSKKEHFILSYGNNGAETFDYVYGKYAKMVRAALQLHGSSLSAVLISGGGNDFAGFDDLRPMLNNDCSGLTKAEACFKPGMEVGTLGWLMNKLDENYRFLIKQICASVRPDAKILMHNYDYAIPSGKGVFGNEGGWIKPALDDAKVPKNLQQGCVNYLIDQLTVVLMELLKIDVTRIFLVDSTKTLNADDWANELHPTSTGFKKIVMEKWQPVLKKLELA